MTAPTQTISLLKLRNEFNTANTSRVRLSDFYTNNALKLTSGQPPPLVASGNRIRFSLFNNVRYTYFQSANETPGANFVSTRVFNQLFLSLNPNIKKNGKLGVLIVYVGRINDVLLIVFVNNVNRFSQWQSSTVPSTLYTIWTLNLTASNINILTTDTILLQFTTLATGRSFNMGLYPSGRPYVSLTIV
jgi:hypothetical protein